MASAHKQTAQVTAFIMYVGSIAIYKQIQYLEYVMIWNVNPHFRTQTQKCRRLTNLAAWDTEFSSYSVCSTASLLCRDFIGLLVHTATDIIDSKSYS